jgi:NitT/TauT family transport system permease protein
MSALTTSVEPSRRVRRDRTVWLSPVAFGAVLLGLWQYLSRLGILDPFYFSRPSAIGARVADWLASGFVYRHLSVTLQEALWGLVLGALAGLAAGLLLARWPWLDWTVGPYLRMANAVPRIVLAPIFLLWFGLGMWSKVALGVTLVFFVVFFNTYQGVRDVDAAILDNARMLGASERQLARHVLLPSALSWIFSSLHLSVGLALIGAVVGEYLGSTEGIGYVIAQREGLFDTTGVFAGLAVLMVVVLAVDHLVGRLERRLLHWKPSSSHGRGRS